MDAFVRFFVTFMEDHVLDTGCGEVTLGTGKVAS